MEREDEFRNLRDGLSNLNFNEQLLSIAASQQQEQQQQQQLGMNTYTSSDPYERISKGLQKHQESTSSFIQNTNNNNNNGIVDVKVTGHKRKSSTSSSQRSIPLIALTKNLLDIYRSCRPGSFRYPKAFQNPRRVLTKENIPAGNFNMDNKHGDLILVVGDIISNPTTGQKFKILEMLGQGTFGQVVKCRTLTSSTNSPSQQFKASRRDGEERKTISSTNSSSSLLPYDDHYESMRSDDVHQFGLIAERKNSIPSMVAIKVVKNRPAYSSQAKVEVKILEKLVRESDRSAPGEKHFHERIVHILDSFQFHSHMCMVFELMSINLFELIKQNDFRGFPIREVASFTSQILSAMKVLADIKIIHCDLKPENILIENFSSPPRLKLVDFGSACFENQTAYTYIQSRFYRAPEVIIGLPYSKCIDIWSLGCIVIELWMGLPLFPGVSNHNQLIRIEEMVGELPEWMLDNGKQTKKLYKQQAVAVSEVYEGIPYQNPSPMPHLPPNTQSPYSQLARDPLMQQQQQQQYLSTQNQSNNRQSYSLRHRGSSVGLGNEEVISIPMNEEEGLDRILDLSGKSQTPILKTKWMLKSPEEYAYDEKLPAPEKMKRYFKEKKLVDVIFKCESKRRPSGESPNEIDRNVLRSMYGLVCGLLSIDPKKRFTVGEALAHPFVSSPAMTDAHSPLRKSSSFFATSPALPSNLSPFGSFSGSPFTPPSRPLVPYPLAHDWNGDSLSSFGSFYHDFDDIGIRNQGYFHNNIPPRSIPGNEIYAGEVSYGNGMQNQTNPYSLNQPYSLQAAPMNTPTPSKVQPNAQQMMQLQQEFQNQQVLQHIFHQQMAQQQQVMQQQQHPLQSPTNPYHPQLQRSQSLQHIPVSSSGPYSLIYGTADYLPSPHPIPTLSSNIAWQQPESLRRADSGVFDTGQYQHQQYASMRSPAISELGNQPHLYTSNQPSTPFGMTFPAFSTGLPAPTNANLLPAISNSSRLYAPMPSMPFPISAPMQPMSVGTVNPGRTPRMSGGLRVVSKSSSSGDDSSEQVASPLTLGSYHSSRPSMFGSETGYQTGVSNYSAGSAMSGYATGGIEQQQQQQPIAASPSYRLPRLSSGMHNRLSFSEQGHQSSPRVRRGSNLRSQQNQLYNENMQMTENQAYSELNAAMSPNRLYQRRSSAFTKFSSGIPPNIKSSSTSPSNVSPSRSKGLRSDSLASNTSDQVSMNDISLHSHGLNETPKHHNNNNFNNHNNNHHYQQQQYFNLYQQPHQQQYHYQQQHQPLDILTPRMIVFSRSADDQDHHEDARDRHFE